MSDGISLMNVIGTLVLAFAAIFVWEVIIWGDELNPTAWIGATAIAAALVYLGRLSEFGDSNN